MVVKKPHPFFGTLRQDLRYYGLIRLILLFILYGPAIATIGLAVEFFGFSDGRAGMGNTPQGGAGVVFIGFLSVVDTDQAQLKFTWSIGGFGEGYGVLEDGSPASDTDVGWLGREAVVTLEKQIMTYDPSLVLHRPTRSSSSFQFSSTHDIDGYNGLPTRQPIQYRTRIPDYDLHVPLSILDAQSNASLPLASSGVLCFSNVVGWSIRRCNFTNVSLDGEALLYILDLSVSVDSWKAMHEKEMAYVMAILTFVAFGMAWRNIVQVWGKLRPRRISDLLATPLGVAGVAGAVRAVFPADSPMQTFWDEGFYYPSILLLIWCAFVTILLTSHTAIKIHDSISAWCHVSDGEQETHSGPESRGQDSRSSSDHSRQPTPLLVAPLQFPISPPRTYPYHGAGRHTADQANGTHSTASAAKLMVEDGSHASVTPGHSVFELDKML